MTKDEFLACTNPGDLRIIVTAVYDVDTNAWDRRYLQGVVHIERSDPHFFFLIKPVLGSSVRDPSVIRYSEVVEVY